LGSTTRSCGWSPPLSSSSIARSRSRCATDPRAGLALVDAILARDELVDYHLAHAARADLCRRLERYADARTAYGRAIALTRQEPERRFLERRLAGLPA
jgi:RNA polymerase sigma-70 factor (ECF subfamily)